MSKINNKILLKLNDNINELSNISFSPVLPDIIGYTNKSYNFYLYNIFSKSSLKIQKQLDTLCTSICLTNDNSSILGLNNGIIKILDFNHDQYIFDIKAHNNIINYIDIHSYSKMFVTSSSDGDLKVWDMRIKNAFRTFNLNNGNSCQYVKISPDSTWISVICDNDTTIIYDILLQQPVKTFNGTGKSGYCLFHQNELMLFTSSKLGNLNLWDLNDSSLLSNIQLNNEIISCMKHNNEDDSTHILLGTENGRIISISNDFSYINYCCNSLASIIYDIFYHDNKIYYIGELENHLSVIEYPYEIFESSFKEIITDSEISNSIYKTPESPIKKEDTLSFTLKDLSHNSCIQQSTPGTTIINNEITFSEKSSKFFKDHTSFIECLESRSKLYDTIIKSIKSKNYSNAFKIISEKKDYNILGEVIGFFIERIDIKDFPILNIIKYLTQYTIKGESGKILQMTLSLINSSHFKFVDKKSNDFKHFYESIRKMNNDKNINLLLLLMDKYFNVNN